MIERFSRSLSARLLVIFLLTSLVYGLASRYAVELVLDRDYLREIAGSHMGRYTSYVLKDLGYPPDIERAKAIIAGNPLDVRIDGPGVHWSSDPDFPGPDSIPFEDSAFIERIRASSNPQEPWVQALSRLGFARHDRHSFVRIDEGDYRIMFVSPKIADQLPHDLTWPIVGLIAVFVLAGCYLAVRWLVLPISWIKEGADRIGRGDLDYRIPRVRNDELGELTNEINRMADDVREMLEAKRQLLLAISHELRSPLTRTKVALEFLEDDEARRSIMDDVQEMENLIHDLLEGEQLNTRHSKLQRSSMDATTLLEQLVTSEFGEDSERLRLDLPDKPVMAELDATRIRLLVKNLVSNALCYSPAEAPPVRIELRAANAGLVMRVIDHGPGMSPADVARATEPFYRADPARCRNTGGFGLGLYLCRRIAEAHGGTLTIASREGEGTEVIVRMPIQAPERVQPVAAA